LRQASRDVLLGLRENIVALFDGIIKKEIARQMSPDVLKEVLVKLIESFAKEKQFEVEVLLSEKDKKSMEKTLLSALKEDLKKGVTLKVSPSIEHGFRIGRKGEHSYYDFTDEAIAESFKTYLNPKVTELLS
jgi:vacuolar-type H+-ATPase subunit E/Vma4